MKSKIHRATVTGLELHYEGSIAIDQDLLEAADLKNTGLRRGKHTDSWLHENYSRFSASKCGRSGGGDTKDFAEAEALKNGFSRFTRI